MERRGQIELNIESLEMQKLNTYQESKLKEYMRKIGSFV